MKFVKIECRTPYVGTDYEEYLVVEDDVTDEYLEMQCKGLAIDIGNYYKHLLKSDMEGMTEAEKNLYYLEYLQDCMDLSTWKYITEYDFDVAMDEQTEIR